jgi:hypothetical protein
VAQLNYSNNTETTLRTCKCSKCENEVINPPKSKRVETLLCANCAHFQKYNESIFATQQRKLREQQAKYKAKQKETPVKPENKPISLLKAKKPIIEKQDIRDILFSKIIRKVYPNYCHSCGKHYEESELQCGHYIGRTNYALRYDLRNALPVCGQCNYFDLSHTKKLEKQLIEKFGTDLLDELQIKKIESQYTERVDKSETIELFKVLYNSLTDDKELNFEKLSIFIEQLKTPLKDIASI